MPYKPKQPWFDGPWRRIRQDILQRDGNLCQINAPGCTHHATQVDHIVSPHQSGAWWDPDNLRAACAKCNRGRPDQARTERWRQADTHITLVVGPPGAGKTTWVQQHAEPGDLIVDYDAIAEALGGTPHTPTGNPLHQATTAARGAILRQLRTGTTGAPRAWIISANPNAETMFPHHRVHIVDPGEQETLRRAHNTKQPARWETLIRDWYTTRNPTTPTQTTSRTW